MDLNDLWFFVLPKCEITKDRALLVSFFLTQQVKYFWRGTLSQLFFRP